jgi:membrane protein DedA with SNARE-associated domain
MFVGKLSFGLAPVFLVVAGIVAVPTGPFFRYAIGVAMVQYSVLLPLGLYCGQAIGADSRAVRLIQLVGVGAALVAIVYARRFASRAASLESGPGTE